MNTNHKLFKLRKFIIFVFIFLLHANYSYADKVHFGLLQYKTAMSHIEKKDKHIIGIFKKLSILLPDSKFLIAGHTDNKGSYEINVELSKARAETVKFLMVEAGISEDRIESKWFSYNAPIDSNDTPEGRKKNRRTVATIYGLTPTQAKKLANSAIKSKYFYIIQIESEKVDSYVNKVLEPKLDKPKDEVVIQDDLIQKTEQQLEEKTSNYLSQKKVVQPSNHRYFVGSGISDNKITAQRNNFKAEWMTDFNYFFIAGYQNEVASNLWIGGSFTYHLQDYQPTDHPLYTWNNQTPNLLNISLNFDYETKSKWFFGLDVNYLERTSVITNGLSISLIPVDLFGISGRASYKIYESAYMRSRLNTTIEYPFIGGGNLEPKGLPGLTLGFDLSFGKIMKQHELNLAAYYSIQKMNNLQNNQTEVVAGLQLTLRNKMWK